MKSSKIKSKNLCADYKKHCLLSRDNDGYKGKSRLCFHCNPLGSLYLGVAVENNTFDNQLLHCSDKQLHKSVVGFSRVGYREGDKGVLNNINIKT